MQDAEEKEMRRSSRSRSRMGKVQRCAVLLLLSPCLLGLRLMIRMVMIMITRRMCSMQQTSHKLILELKTINFSIFFTGTRTSQGHDTYK
jgi:hypothetical protein